MSMFGLGKGDQLAPAITFVPVVPDIGFTLPSRNFIPAATHVALDPAVVT